MAADVQQIAPITETPTISIGEYLGIFRRRIWVILVPMVVGLLVGGFVANQLPKRYETMTRVRVTDPSIAKDLASFRAITPPYKAMLNSIKSDVVNRAFLQPIVEQVGLNEGFNVTDPRSANDLHEYIKKNMTVKLTSPLEKGADIFEIFYVGRDPRKTEAFINACRDKYIENFQKEYRGGVRKFYDDLSAQKRELENQLAEEQARYEAFTNDPEYALIGQETALSKQTDELERIRTSLSVEIQQLETQLKTIIDQFTGQNPEIAVTSMVPNPKRDEKKKLIDEAQSLLTELTVKKGYTDKVKAVQDQQALVEKLRKELEDLPAQVEASTVLQPNSVRTTLENDKNRITRELDGKRKSLTKISEDLSVLRAKLARIPELRADDRAFQGRMSDFGGRLTRTSVQFDEVEKSWNAISGRGSELFLVLEFPRSDMDPVFPNLSLFILIGAGAGLLIGVGIAFVKEFANLTFATADQVQNAIPVRVLGAVSHIESPEEREVRKVRRLRNIAAALFVLMLLGGLHGAYFNPSLKKRLPSRIVKVMDNLYGKKAR